MPPLADRSGLRAAPEGQNLAVAAEALFLVNLMLAPGLAFLGILWLWLKRRKTAPPLARCHIEQTFAASLWAGLLLVIANVAVIGLGGFQSVWTWVIVILWFTCVHSTLILLGVWGLVKAMAGKEFVYPLVGRPCE
jgi:uncharacterized Tic20 family protein